MSTLHSATVFHPFDTVPSPFYRTQHVGSALLQVRVHRGQLEEAHDALVLRARTDVVRHLQADYSI